MVHVKKCFIVSLNFNKLKFDVILKFEINVLEILLKNLLDPFKFDCLINFKIFNSQFDICLTKFLQQITVQIFAYAPSYVS